MKLKRTIEHSNPEVILESLSLFLKDGWKIISINIDLKDGYHIYTSYLEK
jgi:hypothetical protein